MGQVTIECDPNAVSDGYHTFGELYDHRCLLFLALMRSHPQLSWRAMDHDDGSSLAGWFIAGMRLPTGMVTYHLPLKWWGSIDPVPKLERAPKWDGHTSADVLERLEDWLLQLKLA